MAAFRFTDSFSRRCPRCGEKNPMVAVMRWACYAPLPSHDYVMARRRSRIAQIGAALLLTGWAAREWRKQRRPGFAPALLSGGVLALLLRAVFREPLPRIAPPAAPRPEEEEPQIAPGANDARKGEVSLTFLEQQYRLYTRTDPQEFGGRATIRIEAFA